jgi:hypothetical protein
VAEVLYYRLYFFDGFSGHIDHFREFEAEGDAAAIALADRWSDGRAMELWNLNRRLKHWESVPGASG